jgi:putative tricarboxylic transport membrane protein
MIRITHPQDFWSGLLFIAFGAVGAFLSRDFVFGTMTKMGPGFLPTVLSWLLITVGAIVSARSFAIRGGAIERSAIKPQMLIVAAIVLFALLIERVGLVPTVFVVLILASFAAEEFKLRDSVILAVGMSLACYLVFIVLLGLPLRPLAWNF